MRLLLYLTGLLVLGSGIYFVRKSEEKQNAVIYLVFTAVLLMIVQVAEAGILSRIPRVSVTAGVFGLLHVIEGSVLWFFILIKKKRQEYYFELADVAALAVLAVLVAIAAIRQFGWQLDNFNFQADSDGARHYMFARSIADKGQLTYLYFSALNSGLLMNALRGLVSKFFLYRVFIAFEVWVLFLNGAIFWTLIRRHISGKLSIAVGIIITVAYMLGYPWNSMIFGTSYLSTGIMCVAMIIILLDLYLNDVFYSNKITVVLLILSCYALLCSYSLFVPPVVGGALLLFIIKYVQSGAICMRKVYAAGSVLLTVCLLGGIVFLYLWLIRDVFDRELGSLSWWGYNYGALYADFLFVAPFCILWFIKSIKLKMINVESVLLLVFLGYTFVLFLGNCFGKVSAYYYYKVYCILWIVVFVITLRAINLVREEKSFLVSYLVTWGVLFLVFISSVEQKLAQDYNLDLADSSAEREASDYFSLYDFNITFGNQDSISKETKDLYIEAAKLSVQLNAFIPYIGEFEQNVWTYFALAGTEHRNVLDGKNYRTAIEELKNYPYILSVECEEPVIDVSKYLKTLPVVYENESGKIYRVDNVQTGGENRSDGLDVDIILRYGLPRLERMGGFEQDEYVNGLQVIRRIDRLGLDKKEFLYPELEMEKTEASIIHLTDGRYDKREKIIFNGKTSRELQRAIDEHPGTVIDIRSKQIDMRETIVLRNNTAVNGNGAKLVGNGLEYGFIGENIFDIYLSDLCIEGDIDYGIYVIDCNEITISKCSINGLRQKAICVVGSTRGVNISGNEVCNNAAGGFYATGNVSECLIEDNNFSENGGTSRWMSGIVFTGIVPEDKYDIWEDFDREHVIPEKDSVCNQMECPHELIIRNNKIFNNSPMGIYLDGAYKGYVTGNMICRNACGGMGLDYGTMGFYLEKNHFESNGGTDHAGVILDNTAYNILRNNVFRDHYVGIRMVQASVRNLIMENEVYGGGNGVCHQYGIEVGTGIAEDESDREDEEEEEEKIDIVPSYENIICRNSIMGNHYTGVFIDERCYVNDVFDNIIMDARVYAVEAISDKFNSMINNICNTEVRNEYNGG